MLGKLKKPSVNCSDKYTYTKVNKTEMKKIFFILCILTLFVTGCGQKSQTQETTKNENSEAEKKNTPQQKETNLKISAKELESYFRKEEISSQIMIYPKEIQGNADGVYCYFQLKNEKASKLRLRIQYWDEKYADVDQYIFEADGESFEYIANNNRTISGSGLVVKGSIFHWFDNGINKTDLSFIEAIAKANTTKINLIDRGLGKTIDTITLTDQQKESLKRTIDYYFALDGATIPRKGMVNIRG